MKLVHLCMRRLALIAVLSLACVHTPAFAQWRADQRAKFMNDCMPACQANPNVPPEQKSGCSTFCGCMVGQSERLSTAADFDRMDRAAQNNQSDPLIDKITSTAPECNKRAFGN